MRYYTYKYEDYNGNKGEITVKASDENAAWERISDFDVNRGEIHYAWLLNSSETGEEKYYKTDDCATALFVGLMGAALGCAQLGTYGISKDYLSALKNDDVKLTAVMRPSNR